jgi:hypothetical protein
MLGMSTTVFPIVDSRQVSDMHVSGLDVICVRCLMPGLRYQTKIFAERQ